MNPVIRGDSIDMVRCLHEEIAMLHSIYPLPLVREITNHDELAPSRSKLERLFGCDGDSPEVLPSGELWMNNESVSGMPVSRDSVILVTHPRGNYLTGAFQVRESASFGGLPVEHPIVKLSQQRSPTVSALHFRHGAETLNALFRWLTDSQWRADIVTFEGTFERPTFRQTVRRYCAENHPLTAIVTLPETPSERITVALSIVGSLILTGSRCLDRTASTRLETKRARPLGRARATSGGTVSVTP
jgi:hypothetical protein